MPSGVRGLNAIRRPLPQGERASLSDEQHSEADGSENWERISVNGSACGSASEAGEDAIDSLVEEFTDVGFPTIGEESTSAGWDRVPEYEVTLQHRPTTPSACASSSTSLAELLCQGPFANRARRNARGRNPGHHAKRQQWRVTPMQAANIAVSAPAAK